MCKTNLTGIFKQDIFHKNKPYLPISLLKMQTILICMNNYHIIDEPEINMCFTKPSSLHLNLVI